MKYFYIYIGIGLISGAWQNFKIFRNSGKIILPTGFIEGDISEELSVFERILNSYFFMVPLVCFLSGILWLPDLVLIILVKMGLRFEVK